jgi:hypothetical protein
MISKSHLPTKYWVQQKYLQKHGWTMKHQLCAGYHQRFGPDVQFNLLHSMALTPPGNNEIKLQ